MVSGRYKESYELAVKTLEQMRAVLGEEHEETLILRNGFCVDLRARVIFRESLRIYSGNARGSQGCLREREPPNACCHE